MKNSIMCLAIFLFFGCKEQSTEPVSQNQFQQGTYSAQYFNTANGVTDTGTAEISFQDTSFQCTPLQTRHLLPGGGVYIVTKDSIEIRDLWIRVAIYNLTEVMSGKFSYSAAGNKLILNQQAGSSTILKRFELTLTH